MDGRRTDTRDSEAVHWVVSGVYYPDHMVFTREDTRKTRFAKTIVTCYCPGALEEIEFEDVCV
jgi:hypothetical protein